MNLFQNESHSSIMWIAPKYYTEYAVTFKQLIPEKGHSLFVPLLSSSSESDKQAYMLYAFNFMHLQGMLYVVVDTQFAVIQNIYLNYLI